MPDASVSVPTSDSDWSKMSVQSKVQVSASSVSEQKPLPHPPKAGLMSVVGVGIEMGNAVVESGVGCLVGEGVEPFVGG